MGDWFQTDLIFVVLIALCVGSFLGVLVERLPAGRPVVLDRSACPHCGQQLSIRDLIPLIGWITNRGRCHSCGRRLGLFYPAIEILAVLIALWAVAVVPGWPGWVTCVLGWVLLTLAAIDWRYLLLPDSLTLPLIAGGLLVAWYLNPEGLADHGIGAVAGFTLLAIIAIIYRHLRGHEGLGLGDAKLLASAGAWLGWQGLPSVVLVAAAAGLAGALIRARLAGQLDVKLQVPFGPYLAGGFWLVWLYGPLRIG